MEPNSPNDHLEKDTSVMNAKTNKVDDFSEVLLIYSLFHPIDIL